MSFLISPFARIFGTRPEMIFGAMVVWSHASKMGLEVTLGHGMDGKHREASLHYNGLGLDFSITGFSNDAGKVALKERVSRALGQDFDFLLEDMGKPNEHWHLEFQPKAPY